MNSQEQYEDQYSGNDFEQRDDQSGPMSTMQDEFYNNQMTYNSHTLTKRSDQSSMNAQSKRSSSRISMNDQNNFDSKKSRGRYVYSETQQFYDKLFQKVNQYETDPKRVNRKFHQYKNLFPNLNNDELIQLVKGRFKTQKSKFQFSGKDPKKQHQQILKRHSITPEIEQDFIKAYFQYEANLEHICEWYSDFIEAKSGNFQQPILIKEVELLLIVRIKASICKLQGFIKKKRLAKMFIPFNQLQQNEISYRFLQVHRGKVYSMDKALPLVTFQTIFSQQFISEKIQINDKEALHLYKFMINVLSAVQSQNHADKKKISKMNVIKSTKQENRTHQQNKNNTSSFSIQRQHSQLDINGDVIDEWYTQLVRFYLQCGDWKRVLQKLLDFYGPKFQYYQWSTLQRKVQSFFRVIYLLFVTKLTSLNGLFKYKQQLPPQGKIKFIQVTTWDNFQTLRFMLFYFYLHGKDFQTYHFKEIIEYLIKYKDELCSNKKEKKNGEKIDLLKLEENPESQNFEGNNQNSQKFLIEQQQKMIELENQEVQKQIINNKKQSQKEQKIIKAKQTEQKQIKLKQDLQKYKPRFTLEQKLKQVQQKWKQNEKFNFNFKDQIKKQPKVWRPIYGINSSYQSFNENENFSQNPSVLESNLSDINHQEYVPHSFNQSTLNGRNFSNTFSKNNQINHKNSLNNNLKDYHLRKQSKVNSSKNMTKNGFYQPYGSYGHNQRSEIDKFNSSKYKVKQRLQNRTNSFNKPNFQGDTFGYNNAYGINSSDRKLLYSNNFNRSHNLSIHQSYSQTIWQRKYFNNFIPNINQVKNVSRPDLRHINRHSIYESNNIKSKISISPNQREINNNFLEYFRIKSKTVSNNPTFMKLNNLKQFNATNNSGSSFNFVQNYFNSYRYTICDQKLLELQRVNQSRVWDRKRGWILSRYGYGDNEEQDYFDQEQYEQKHNDNNDNNEQQQQCEYLLQQDEQQLLKQVQIIDNTNNEYQHHNNNMCQQHQQQNSFLNNNNVNNCNDNGENNEQYCDNNCEQYQQQQQYEGKQTICEMDCEQQQEFDYCDGQQQQQYEGNIRRIMALDS